MDELRSKVKDISHNYRNYLMSLENVNGIGYGYKYVNNKNTFEPCIHILVEKKINENYLLKNNIIPKTYMGIKTDIIEVGKSKFLDNTYPKERPLKGGCCISELVTMKSGTICCIVKKKVSKFFQKAKYEYYVLSNNHVMAFFNKNPIGTMFTQPNTNNEQDIVAMLDTYIPIKFVEEGKEAVNYVDCAIAKVINNTAISDMISRFGKIKGIAKAELGMDVKKNGYKSNVTRGKVKSLDLSTKMVYDIDKSNKTLDAIFENQILVDVYSEPGDSGSPIVTFDNRLIGMGMGGIDEVKPSKFHSFIINDINLVLKLLKVKIYTIENDT